MKILLSSYAFSPSIGGIEHCSLMLANAFQAAGHDVIVITFSEKREERDDHGLCVIRRPSMIQLLRLSLWCDLVFHNNISLRAAWPLLLISKPWVVTTQTWLTHQAEKFSFSKYVKQKALSIAQNIFISESIRQHVGLKGITLGNPYDAELFKIHNEIVRDRNLVFLGRLVSDKGCGMLLEALLRLKQEGVEVDLSIIGDGPERGKLEEFVKRNLMTNQILFRGSLVGEALSKELNRHHYLVVPSLWKEPFGIVALEGIACGCAVVGSSGGGLAEAIGSCGMVFENGNLDRLIELLREVDGSTSLYSRLMAGRERHLSRFNSDKIAKDYLAVFEKLCLNE